MSEPGVCEPEADCAAVFLEFIVALDKRLRRSRGSRWEKELGGGLQSQQVDTHTHTHLAQSFLQHKHNGGNKCGTWQAF